MYEYRAKLDRAVDGDTLDLDVDLGFKMAFNARFRLVGIDTPEVRGPEREDGLKATEWIRERLGDREFTIVTEKDSTGKYGRYLATIFVDGVNVNKEMVELGIAEKMN